nr:GDP-mannose 4,6-dehydratase [Caldilineaceae bacterium]
MQNLLITGGAGFIGCNFVRYVLQHHSQYRVVVYDKLTYAGRLENLAEVGEQFAGRYTFVQGDIGDAARVEETVRDHSIDTIINFAAETHVDRSILDPHAFLHTNVLGTYTLLETARKCGNLRYHQVSTDEVYGHIHGDHRSAEQDPIVPRSPYAASKASADHFVNAYFITYGLPITISRGANNIGPFQYPEKAVPLFVTNALNDQPLPVYGDGQQMRDYQYVGDHCEGIDLVLHKGVIGEVYNI